MYTQVRINAYGLFLGPSHTNMYFFQPDYNASFAYDWALGRFGMLKFYPTWQGKFNASVNNRIAPKLYRPPAEPPAKESTNSGPAVK